MQAHRTKAFSFGVKPLYKPIIEAIHALLGLREGAYHNLSLLISPVEKGSSDTPLMRATRLGLVEVSSAVSIGIAAHR
jgi:hypothetical protein